MTTTTLKAIRAKSPCRDGWAKLLATLGKVSDDDDPLALLTVLDSNGLDDALWVLQNTGCDKRLSRHFSAWCAEQVLYLFETERPDDMRPRQAIACARDDNASPEAWAAARDASWAASWDAARTAAGTAAGAAARAVAGAVAWADAWDAARTSAVAVAGDAARTASWAKQERQLRKMLTEGF